MEEPEKIYMTSVTLPKDINNNNSAPAFLLITQKTIICHVRNLTCRKHVTKGIDFRKKQIIGLLPTKHSGEKIVYIV
jgi:hypothetical protein